MDIAAVYARTVISWQLAFAHAGKMLHHLKSALLMTTAVVGLSVAWICCWLDRFLSGKRAGAWLISPRRARRSLEEPGRPVAVPEKMQPIAFEKNHARTIDSLIRDRNAVPRIYEAGNAPSIH